MSDDSQMTLASSDIDASSGYPCPRCAATIHEEFYGPCPSCRTELRATMRRASDDAVADEEYVPKMNVTPNAVALKDD